jgi:NADH dehydrogenase [ubiquinone] 1 alpha subcomplex assembly factor 5
MDDPVDIFDRVLHRRRRDRAAARLAEHDFLLREIGERLFDRLDDVRRQFRRVLLLGGTPDIADRLRRRVGVELVVAADPSAGIAGRLGSPAVAADEEFVPFRDGAFDLIVAPPGLHWVNDLPGALLQLRRTLEPDGLFLGALPGGDTLFELRRALMEAEVAALGGLSPRISPMVGVRDAGSLLQRAGFTLPVVDTDRLTIAYSDPWKLLEDLRGAGETNAVKARRRVPATRALIAEAMRLYRAHFEEADGRVPATVEVIYLTGWSPSDSQPKPLRRGSATGRLADALKTSEIPGGAKAGS